MPSYARRVRLEFDILGRRRDRLTDILFLSLLKSRMFRTSYCSGTNYGREGGREGGRKGGKEGGRHALVTTQG